MFESPDDSDAEEFVSNLIVSPNSVLDVVDKVGWSHFLTLFELPLWTCGHVLSYCHIWWSLLYSSLNFPMIGINSTQFLSIVNHEEFYAHSFLPRGGFFLCAAIFGFIRGFCPLHWTSYSFPIFVIFSLMFLPPTCFDLFDWV